MFWTLALAALAVTQPSARATPAVRDIVWLPVGGSDREATAALEALVPARGEGSVRFRRSARDPEALRRCLDDRGLVDRVNRCIRRLLPAREGGAPLVALAIDNETVSNVTGSVTFIRHNLYCIGYRSVGYARLGDRVQAPGTAARARELLRACLAEAAATAPLGSLRLTGGERAPVWQLGPGAPAGDANHARGSSAEQATVRIESRRAGPRGRCTLAARVRSVEQGERLREGDRIRIALPCSAVRAGSRPGTTARLYIGYDGGLRWLGPLEGLDRQ